MDSKEVKEVEVKKRGRGRSKKEETIERVLVFMLEDQAITGELQYLCHLGIMLVRAGVSNGEGKGFNLIPGEGKVFIPMHRIETVQYLPKDAEL